MITIMRCGEDHMEQVIEAMLRVKREDDSCDANADNIARFLHTPGALFYVAKLDSSVVSYAVAYRMSRLDGDDMFCLYEIGTTKRHRGQGIAKILLSHILADARSTGIHKVWIPTTKSNKAACALYRSVGASAAENDDVIFTCRL
ncbi:MAG: hypothetical protein ABT01_01670 [Clostridium sp. SCN 57-10]|nr:MAG: hypothetical protein ABT01_01670 [Clostridium sp. SCN 57-10]